MDDDPKRPSSNGSDRETVEGFGFEWSVYDQTRRDRVSMQRSFDRYFALFPWAAVPSGSRGLDVGSGSGRWTALVLERGLSVVALDASPEAARVTARTAPGASVAIGTATELPFASESFGFAFSLGVLHHLPDTEGALREIHRVLRRGSPFLIYLYYAFDNRPWWFRTLWRISDRMRRAISSMPYDARLRVTQLIAASVYWPLSRLAVLLERAKVDVESFPLSAYRHQQFYVMKTDALDRFGTRLEKRYTREEIRQLLALTEFQSIRFSEDWPFWCAVAFV